MRRGGPTVAILLAAALAACQSPNASPTPPTGLVSPAASTPAASTPAAPTDAELEAIRFRTTFGLRADLAFVREVANDPTASSTDFQVPLLPEEVLDLRNRSANADAVREIVTAEAEAHPDDYCGRYIDNQNGGAFTSMWRANLAIHAATIQLQAGPFAHLGFVACTFSESDLNELTDRLGGVQNAKWVRAIPAAVTGWGPNVSSNRVEVDVSSAVPDAPDRIRTRLEAELHLPPGILVVLSDGTGVQLVGWGTVRVTVTRPDGSDVGPNELGLSWTPAIDGLTCGGDVGFGVPSNGEPVDLPCQEGSWTIQVLQAGELLGEGRVVVHRDNVVELTITLTKNPPSAG